MCAMDTVIQTYFDTFFFLRALLCGAVVVLINLDHHVLCSGRAPLMWASKYVTVLIRKYLHKGERLAPKKCVIHSRLRTGLSVQVFVKINLRKKSVKKSTRQDI